MVRVVNMMLRRKTCNSLVCCCRYVTLEERYSEGRVVNLTTVTTFNTVVPVARKDLKSMVIHQT